MGESRLAHLPATPTVPELESFNRLADALLQGGYSALDDALGDAGVSMQRNPADDFIAVWRDGYVVAHVVPVASPMNRSAPSQSIRDAIGSVAAAVGCGAKDRNRLDTAREFLLSALHVEDED